MIYSSSRARVRQKRCLLALDDWFWLGDKCVISCTCPFKTFQFKNQSSVNQICVHVIKEIPITKVKLSLTCSYGLPSILIFYVYWRGTGTHCGFSILLHFLIHSPREYPPWKMAVQQSIYSRLLSAKTAEKKGWVHWGKWQSYGHEANSKSS